MSKTKLGIVLLAFLLAAMAIVPCMSAADDTYDKQLEKWQADHTIPVTKTVTQYYSDGILTVDTSFTGKELTKRFGIDAFSLRNQLKVSAEDAEKLN